MRSGCCGTPSNGLTLAADSSLDDVTTCFKGDALLLADWGTVLPPPPVECDEDSDSWDGESWRDCDTCEE